MANGSTIRDYFAPNVWYIGISGGESGFLVWAGLNCINNCSNSGSKDKNTCWCNGAACSANSWSADMGVYPTNYSDSNGNCECSGSDNSYDCNFKVSSSTQLHLIYIILIAIGGLVIIALAIGVPLY